jgi:uncharacterized sulfatase
MKRDLTEGGIRVPLIARWPGKIAPGTIADHPSAFWDFVPTACELAGIDPPSEFNSESGEGTDGISYLPTLLGKADEQEKHEYLFWASQEGATSVGLRMQNWKLVKYRAGKKKRGQKDLDVTPASWRLYDLDKDIGEENDIAKEQPGILQKMLSILERDGLGAPPPK